MPPSLAPLGYKKACGFPRAGSGDCGRGALEAKVQTPRTSAIIECPLTADAALERPLKRQRFGVLPSVGPIVFDET